MLKKVIQYICVAILLISSFLVTGNVNSVSAKVLNEEDFIKLIKKSESYKEFKNDFLKILGAVCTLVGTPTIFGRLLCSGGVVIGCYIPQYKYCIEGRWYSTCLQP